jgi:hypothetical protein
MKRYSVEMLAVDPHENIGMGEYDTREEAEKRLKECEDKDWLHYFEIFEKQ